MPDAETTDRRQLDLNAPLENFDWTPYGTVINAAAYTAVDAAEGPEGRRAAWHSNVAAVAGLAAAARQHRFTLVHLSSDYVFDGTESCYDEDAPLCPLGVYGQTKAAGDALVATVDKHYLVRTSWVIGAGNNFVRTMAALADKGVSPQVIDDQRGRLSFTDDLARGIGHLLKSAAPYGTYNLSSDGDPVTWADIAATVFTARGRDAAAVRRVSTDTYSQGRTGISPRPKNSVLALAKIKATGFNPVDGAEALHAYLATLEPVDS